MTQHVKMGFQGHTLKSLVGFTKNITSVSFPVIRVKADLFLFNQSGAPVSSILL